MIGRSTASPGRRTFEHLGAWTAVLVVSLLVTSLALQILGEWLGRDLGTLRVRARGQPVSDTEIALNHSHVVAWTKGVLVLLVLSAGLWLWWQFQAHRNLRSLGEGRRWFGPATGVLAWAVPVLDLVLPPLAFAELWLRSDPEEGTADQGHRWPVLLVGVWWTLFLTSAVMAAAALVRTPGTGASITRLIARDELDRRAVYAGIGAAAAGSVMLVWITARLNAKEARLASLAEGQPRSIW